MPKETFNKETPSDGPYISNEAISLTLKALIKGEANMDEIRRRIRNKNGISILKAVLDTTLRKFEELGWVQIWVQINKVVSDFESSLKSGVYYELTEKGKQALLIEFGESALNDAIEIIPASDLRNRYMYIIAGLAEKKSFKIEVGPKNRTKIIGLLTPISHPKKQTLDSLSGDRLDGAGLHLLKNPKI